MVATSFSSPSRRSAPGVVVKLVMAELDCDSPAVSGKRSCTAGVAKQRSAVPPVSFPNVVQFQELVKVSFQDVESRPTSTAQGLGRLFSVLT